MKIVNHPKSPQSFVHFNVITFSTKQKTVILHNGKNDQFRNNRTKE
jgi:hypothetical protein